MAQNMLIKMSRLAIFSNELTKLSKTKPCTLANPGAREKKQKDLVVFRGYQKFNS